MLPHPECACKFQVPIPLMGRPTGGVEDPDSIPSWEEASLMFTMLEYLAKKMQNKETAYQNVCSLTHQPKDIQEL